jgi:site-specific DNA-methyltransferase (adenine-specific)
VDAVVTDPPYELGFMGKKWDSSGVAFRPEMWAECLRVMKPGAYLLAFSGTRTYHRMACAIEDAGFEIRDQVQWLYGEGFPKSKNLDGEFKGRGTALKPANEPICMARKPLAEATVEANVSGWGTGALNIDAARVPSGPDHAEKCASVVGLDRGSEHPRVYGKAKGPRPDSYNEAGRWPANVLFDEYAAGLLDGKAPDASRFFYVAKPDDSERNQGLDAEPKRAAGIKNDSGRGYSERDPYRKIMRENFHPTVKPVDLMSYLIKLVTPPQGVVLDPFIGSGTTGIAAARLGHPFLGCELSPEYLAIAEKRIAPELAQGKLL